jgi:hypothetical protein
MTMPAKKDLPSTVARSGRKARETWGNTHEKVGDHWEQKDGKGPSDAQAARKGAAARSGAPTAGGVDANASKAHLMDVARRLDVPGRSSMTKDELVQAIQRANDRETSRARS